MRKIDWHFKADKTQNYIPSILKENYKLKKYVCLFFRLILFDGVILISEDFVRSCFYWKILKNKGGNNGLNTLRFFKNLLWECENNKKVRMREFLKIIYTSWEFLRKLRFIMRIKIFTKNSENVRISKTINELFSI
jgi:hypothetical protein